MAEQSGEIANNEVIRFLPQQARHVEGAGLHWLGRVLTAIADEEWALSGGLLPARVEAIRWIGWELIRRGAEDEKYSRPF